jgi:hypothetical protein
MNAIAKKLPPDGQLASEELKKQRIPKRIVRACELLASGECKTITAAAERVGVTREWLSRLLQRSHVQVFIARKSRENIQRGVLRASNRIIELLDASSEHVSLDASKHILAIEGIKPSQDAQVSVNIDIKAGYVIDLTDKPDPVRTIDLTHK